MSSSSQYDYKKKGTDTIAADNTCEEDCKMKQDKQTVD